MEIKVVSDIQETGTKVNPDILKREILKMGEIPGQDIFMIQIVLQPGQSTEPHKRDTLHEIFYVISGKAKFAVGDEEKTVEGGSVVQIKPGEIQSQSNPFPDPVTLLCFGVATENKG